MSLLPAYVEIMLAAGDVEDARDACRELEEIARSFDTGVPERWPRRRAGRWTSPKATREAALGSLRRAFELWQRIEAPYAAARVRELIGLACRAPRRRRRCRPGDRRGQVHIRAPRRRAGSGADRRADEGALPATRIRLTPRELQVLRLVAAGETNKAIAAELFLSERTIERHLSNIFTKLDLSTRAAATAWAYEHGLI